MHIVTYNGVYKGILSALVKWQQFRSHYCNVANLEAVMHHVYAMLFISVQYCNIRLHSVIWIWICWSIRFF